MSSTRAHGITPRPTITGRKISARSPAAGLLARRPAIGVGLFLLGGLVFGILAINVQTKGPLLTWDVPIAQFFHVYARHDTVVGLYAMRISGAWGRETAAIITVVLALYWLWKRHWYELSMLLIGVVGGNIWFEVLSAAFKRHRPIFTDPLDPLPGPGFPSGHSITAVLLYGLILYLLLPHLPSWRWRLLAALDAVLVILMIGSSRLYMGSHYLTDVVGGYSFGLAWGALVYTSIEFYRMRRQEQYSKN